MTGTLTRVKRSFGSFGPSDLSELLLEYLYQHLPLLGLRRKLIWIGDCVVKRGSFFSLCVV